MLTALQSSPFILASAARFLFAAIAAAFVASRSHCRCDPEFAGLQSARARFDHRCLRYVRHEIFLVHARSVQVEILRFSISTRVRANCGVHRAECLSVCARKQA